MSHATNVLSYLIYVPTTGIALVIAGFVFRSIRWLPSLLGLPVFAVIFIVVYRLFCTALAFVAIFTDAVALKHCLRCQYDLQGITTPICPECGEPFSSTDLHGDDNAIA